MRFRRFNTSFRRFFSALVLMMPMVAAAPALANEIFTLRNVPVDATAETAASARDAALAQGYVDAYARLVQRLVSSADIARVPQLTASQIADYTLDFSVARERTSSVRYLAEITYRFRPDEVRRLFRNNEIAFAETRSKPVVVLPLQDFGETTVLWEDGNFWRDAWALRDASGGLVPLIVPLGDLSDITSISAEEAIAGDAVRLAGLAERYDAGGVLVSRALLSGDPEVGGAELALSTTRFDAQGAPLPLGIEVYRQQPEEEVDALYQRAAAAVEAALQGRWKESNLLQYGVESVIEVRIPVAALGDWVEVQRRLGNVPAVVARDVLAVSRQQVELSMTYIGDQNQLALALQQNDLTLSLNELLVWELRLAEGVSGGAETSSGPAALPGGASQPSSQNLEPGAVTPRSSEPTVQPQGVSDLGAAPSEVSPQPIE